MNAAQTALYFREWGLARKWYVAHGVDPKQADNKRHELHRKALGHDKSSKHFNNADLDAVLGAFRAVYDGGNFDAQMNIQNQPERRIGKMQAEAWALVRTVDWVAKADHVQFASENYLNKLAKSTAGVSFEQLTETKLARVLGILKSRLKAPAAVEAERLEEADKNPF